LIGKDPERSGVPSRLLSNMGTKLHVKGGSWYNMAIPAQNSEELLNMLVFCSIYDFILKLRREINKICTIAGDSD